MGAVRSGSPCRERRRQEQTQRDAACRRRGRHGARSRQTLPGDRSPRGSESAGKRDLSGTAEHLRHHDAEKPDAAGHEDQHGEQVGDRRSVRIARRGSSPSMTDVIDPATRLRARRTAGPSDHRGLHLTLDGRKAAAGHAQRDGVRRWFPGFRTERHHHVGGAVHAWVADVQQIFAIERASKYWISCWRAASTDSRSTAVNRRLRSSRRGNGDGGALSIGEVVADAHPA